MVVFTSRTFTMSEITSILQNFVIILINNTHALSASADQFQVPIIYGHCYKNHKVKLSYPIKATTTWRHIRRKKRPEPAKEETSGTCLEGNRTDIEKVGQYTGRNECPSEQEVPRHSNKGKSHTKCAHNTRRPPIRKTFTPDQRQWGADRVKERKQNNFTRWIEITSKKMMIAMKYQKNISLFNEGFCNVNFFISHL